MSDADRLLLAFSPGSDTRDIQDTRQDRASWQISELIDQIGRDVGRGELGELTGSEQVALLGQQLQVPWIPSPGFLPPGHRSIQQDHRRLVVLPELGKDVAELGSR